MSPSFEADTNLLETSFASPFLNTTNVALNSLLPCRHFRFVYFLLQAHFRCVCLALGRPLSQRKTCRNSRDNFGGLIVLCLFCKLDNYA